MYKTSSEYCYVYQALIKNVAYGPRSLCLALAISIHILYVHTKTAHMIFENLQMYLVNRFLYTQPVCIPLLYYSLSLLIIHSLIHTHSFIYLLHSTTAKT